MRNWILGVLLTLVAMPTFAQNGNYVSTDGLTEQQKAEIALQVAKLKSQPIGLSTTVREEAEAWGTLGANMGKAIVGAATEIGVAANDFAQTPLGTVTVAIVVYKFIGQELLGIAVGSVVLFVGYWLAICVLTRYRFAKDVKYDYKPFLFGLWQRRVVVELSESDEWSTVRLVLSALLLVMSTVVGLNTIF